MIIAIHALGQLERINSKEKLEPQDFEDAASAIIEIRQDLENIVAQNNQQTTIYAIGNITKLSSILFSEIREALDKKSISAISYKELIKTSDQYFTPELKEFKDIFAQIDKFRTKCIKSPNFNVKAKQAMLKVNADYLAKQILKTSDTEITNIVTKIERDMLIPILLKDGWLDYKAVKQSINFLNDILASIQKTIKKNPLLSSVDIDLITKKIEAAKKSFSERIVRLSPISEYIVEALNKSHNETELQVISEHISAIAKTLAIERESLNLKGAVKDRMELAKRLNNLVSTDLLNIASGTKKELSKAVQCNVDLFKKTNLVFETPIEIYHAATKGRATSNYSAITATPNEKVIKSAQQFRHDLTFLKKDPFFSLEEKAALHNAKVIIKQALKERGQLDTYKIPRSSLPRNLFAHTGKIMKLIIEKTKNSLTRYNSR